MNINKKKNGVRVWGRYYIRVVRASDSQLKLTMWTRKRRGEKMGTKLVLKLILYTVIRFSSTFKKFFQFF